MHIVCDRYCLQQTDNKDIIHAACMLVCIHVCNNYVCACSGVGRARGGVGGGFGGVGGGRRGGGKRGDEEMQECVEKVCTCMYTCVCVGRGGVGGWDGRGGGEEMQGCVEKVK